MDGKPTIKIMNKAQLLATLKFENTQCYNKIKKARKFSTKKRTSTPTVSTSISIQRKTNSINQVSTIRKLQTNNFMTSNSTNIFTVMSCKRMSQCQTIMARPIIKRQEPIQKTLVQKLLCKNSDKMQKLLWNQPEQFLQPLIISADFIMDQDQFWSSPKICPQPKPWKQLHKSHYIIWVIRLQKCFKTLKKHSEQHGLPLHAVYYQKKQNRYTVDYTPIKRQLIKVYGSRLGAMGEIKIVENLRLNMKDVYEYGSFLGKVPVVLDGRFGVYYVRGEACGGLDVVWQLCKGVMAKDKGNKVIQLKSIKLFIQQYYNKLLQQKPQPQQSPSPLAPKLSTQPSLQKHLTQYFHEQYEQQAERQIQNFRSKLVEQVIREKGRNFQVDGFSVHYFVGDIVKRNYRFLVQAAVRRIAGGGAGDGVRDGCGVGRLGEGLGNTKRMLSLERKQVNQRLQNIHQFQQTTIYKEFDLGILQKFYQYCI